MRGRNKKVYRKIIAPLLLLLSLCRRGTLIADEYVGVVKVQTRCLRSACCYTVCAKLPSLSLFKDLLEKKMSLVKSLWVFLGGRVGWGIIYSW